jgi:hypothetical protein
LGQAGARPSYEERGVRGEERGKKAEKWESGERRETGVRREERGERGEGRGEIRDQMVPGNFFFRPKFVLLLRRCA